MSVPFETKPHLRLLDSDTLARLSRIEIAARGVVEGFIAGLHKSPFKGASPEFAEHRQYTPADNIRDLDWKLLARTDRYYVKQYIEETNLRATIVLDASGSMGYTGSSAIKKGSDDLSKFEYARYLSASLAYLMFRQLDAVGLVTFDKKIRGYVPPRNQRSHLNVILEHIDNCKTGGETSLDAVLHDIAERIPRRGLVIIISDLLCEIEPLLESLHHLRYRKHEVAILQTLAREELEFPFKYFTDFNDMESIHRLQIDPRSIRKTYIERLEHFMSRLKTSCGQMQADHYLFATDENFDNKLADFLASRLKKNIHAGGRAV